MNISLTDISKQQLRKPGFLSSSVVIGKDMILLFKADKDVILDNHNHPHVQLGYCFRGDFDFDVEGDHYQVTKGHSYLLQSRVYHAAVATSDYYSMDIKVIVDTPYLPQKMSQNIFVRLEENEQYLLTKTQVGNCFVRKITYQQPAAINISINQERSQYIIVSRTCFLRFGNFITDFLMEPMKIYLLNIDIAEFDIKVDRKDVEVLLIEY